MSSDVNGSIFPLSQASLYNPLNRSVKMFHMNILLILKLLPSIINKKKIHALSEEIVLQRLGLSDSMDNILKKKVLFKSENKLGVLFITEVQL